jgi:mycothiol synthase
VTRGQAWRQTVRVSGASEVVVRPVGFRAGTDEELAALHAVETPVAAERGSNRMPQPPGAYVASARNLPSQFHDHAWLAETAGGTPVAAGFCWSNSSGDPRVMECDLFVRRDHRRRGIGSRLLSSVLEVSAAEQRPLLTWSTFGAVPAGEAFSRQLGGQVARLNHTSELSVADLDWKMISSWTRAGRARELGYQVELVDGAFPERLRADAVTFHRIMETAPQEGLDAGQVTVDAGFVAQLDLALVAAGRTRWTVFVRDPAGQCVGGTEVTFEPGNPGTVFQQNTGIDPVHRGLGLAKWAKALMLERISRECPQARRVRTENASSNAPMLAINRALGFQVTGTRTEWQARLDDLLLHSPPGPGPAR